MNPMNIAKKTLFGWHKSPKCVNSVILLSHKSIILMKVQNQIRIK